MTRAVFLIKYYSEAILILIVAICIIVLYIRKGWIKVKGILIVECKLKELLDKHWVLISVLANAIIIETLLWIVYAWVFIFVRDIPYAYKGEFIYVEGIVTKSPNIDSTNITELYNITVREFETGEEVNVELYGKNGIYVGDIIKGEYLPYSRQGILLDIESSRK